MNSESSASAGKELTFHRSLQLHERAQETAPGGVHSNVRMLEQPWPLFFESGSGGHLRDVDGNDLVDYVLGQGPMLLGHDPSLVTDAVLAQVKRGLLFGGQHALEFQAAEKLVEMIPSVERVRFNMTGTEAVQAAIRLARASTGRAKIVKFQGHYDGWADSVNYSRFNTARSEEDDDLLAPIPESLGIPESVSADLLITAWNDASRLERVLTNHGSEIAAVLMEPVMANFGVIEPEPSYLQRVRKACSDHGVVLIFDEVITGFRLGPAGAQGRYGVKPDLSVFGKALASGFPVACVAGRADLFDGVARNEVMHAGTFNANPVGLAAVVATLNILSDPSQRVYERIEAIGQQLMGGLSEIVKGATPQILIQGVPALFAMSFTPRSIIRNFTEASDSDRTALRAFLPHLVGRGVRIASSGNFFISSAHTHEDVTFTLDAFEAALSGYRQASR